jgi:hypothetical protein
MLLKRSVTLAHTITKYHRRPENPRLSGDSTELSTKRIIKIQALPTFPDFDGQKKQYFYDLSDNFLTLNV